MIEIGRLFVWTRICPWTEGGGWRRDIYDTGHEHVEYVYLGKYNLIWGWAKHG